MSSLLIAMALIAAPADPPQAAEQLAPRRFHEIHEDVRDVIRVEARAKSDPARAAAIVRMTSVYLEIKRDPRLDSSDTLKSYKAKLWSRLTRIKRDLEREFGPARQRGPAPRGHASSPVSANTAAPKTSAQLASTDRLAYELTDSLAEQLNFVGSALGGPGQMFAGSESAASRGGNAVADYGPDLIDLIERTIAPDFWDTNGGPGSIFYYRSLHALVVSATAEVHHQLGGVLGGLRRASN